MDNIVHQKYFLSISIFFLYFLLFSRTCNHYLRNIWSESHIKNTFNLLPHHFSIFETLKDVTFCISANHLRLNFEFIGIMFAWIRFIFCKRENSSGPPRRKERSDFFYKSTFVTQISNLCHVLKIECTSAPNCFLLIFNNWGIRNWTQFLK